MFVDWILAVDAAATTADGGTGTGTGTGTSGGIVVPLVLSISYGGPEYR